MDRIIQAIEAMAWLEEKAEELVRMANIINNTMADAETGTLLAGEEYLSQTSFGHISINSSSILTVLMATESPWKDFSIDTGHVSRRSIMAEILGRSTGNHYSTVY